MEIVVRERKVVLKDRLGAREAWPVLQIIRKTAAAGTYGTTSYEEEVAMMRACIVSWEFAGDPQNVEAYADLDIFQEFVPLSNAIGNHLRTLVVGGLPQAAADLADEEPMPKN